MSSTKVPLCSLRVSDLSLTLQGKQLAESLAIPFVNTASETLQLVLTPAHLELHAPAIGGPIIVDFLAGKNAHRRQFGGGRGQPLAKAVGLKGGATPRVIDATAGFGKDAFVLASLGCQVMMVEQQPLIAALVVDAMQRASEQEETAGIISRLQLHQGNAISYLSSLTEADRPDVVYLDPMYPAREKSALVKKEMQLLHQLVGPDSNTAELLDISRKVALKRVAVKRPKGAEYFANQKPHVSIESKNTRYDIYTP